MCRACGTQFWDPNRLSRHLRDSPSCVDTLRQHGYLASAIAPGVGSRGWRRNHTEHFHPAVPAKIQGALEPRVDEQRDDVPMSTHKALCDDLLQPNIPTATNEVASRLKLIIDQFPLYVEEIREILATLAVEIQDVREALLEDYWTSGQLAVALSAIEHLQDVDWTKDNITAEEEAKAVPFDDIALEVERVNWDEIWCATRRKHVTPSYAVFELSANWEAELLDSFKALDVSAVQDHLWAIVPPALRDTWLQILKGYAPALKAPQSFWCLQLAVPFRHLQHHSAS